MSSGAFLVLHGLANHRPPGHWQHWLTEELRAAGRSVAYPGLPDPEAPRFASWRAAALAALPPAPVTVICHSLGCWLWLALAPAVAPGRVQRLLLVAPPAPADVPEAGRDVVRDIDPARVRTATPGIGVVSSAADPYDTHGAAPSLATTLGARHERIAGAGHIAPEDGYGPWPAMLAWCLGRSETVRR